ncbi:uncharacterized protein LOC130712795 [Lotus japonicus]|uniref:uncharacterized protein LOC130712795 n=1 Tax=Lotus japonicus TaxID=34305 RepID=UPI00258D34B7|nr:uncharacterized protein LOC130712795 [Lotus japonicus]
MKQIEREAVEKEKLVQVPLPTGTTSLRPPLDDGSKKRKGGALEKAWNNEARDQLTSEIARFFYSAGLPFNVARNPYFVKMLNFAANYTISGFVPPGYNSIRTTLLQKEKANIMKLLEPIKDTWLEKGVSIVTDGWTDVQRRPLINFMAICDSGPMFLKSVDGSGEFKDKHYIARKILETIRDVRPLDVVQTPCVVHILNLALKSICAPKNTDANQVAYKECSWIFEIADAARLIKNFIMNHSKRLFMFNQFVRLKLLAVADTRFASTLIMLKRLRDFKHGLLSMVIDEQWSSYQEDDPVRATFVKETILKDSWWKEVDYILSFTNPIYDMLRACDTDESTFHLVYEKWDCMIEQVKVAIFQHEGKGLDEYSSFCEVAIAEVPNRVPPHKDNEICIGRMQCVRRYFQDARERNEAFQEFYNFSTGAEGLDRFDCLQDRWDLKPKVWRITYGAALPKLQTIALKLFSQPSSSSSTERNWSTYSFIHSLKRNKLHFTRAQDLVFIHTNLRLLSRKSQSYKEGETKMWDIGGDEWDLEGSSILEGASLSLDEPELQAVLFIENENDTDGV